MEHTFSELGSQNIEQTAQLLDKLKINSYDLESVDVSKLKEVVSFLNQYEDGMFLIDKILAKNVNPHSKPLDHAWNYIKLQNRKNELKKEQAKIDEEIGIYE